MDAINDWETKRSPTGTAWHPMRTLRVTRPSDLAATYSRELSRGFVQLSGSWQFRLFEGPLPSPTRSSPRTSPSGITWRFRTCGR